MNRRSLSQRLSGAVTWPVADTLAAHIRAEQVRVVFGQAPPAQLLAIVAAAVICWVLWEHRDHQVLIIWFTLSTLVTVGRIGLAMAFARRQPGSEAMPAWERAFLVSLAAVTLAWGVGGWVIMPRDSDVHRAIVYFFLMGVAGGAVATYAAHTVACYLAVCALMLPATIGFAFVHSLELRVMAMGGLLYVVAALRSTRTFGYFLRRTFQLSYELRDAYAKAREQSLTDELTGLANRRAFVEQARSALDQARRYQRPLTLLMLDIDHFKRINDTHGHAAGDEALRATAAVLRGLARLADRPGRLGGEEFAVLLPETRRAEAMAVAERIRRDVSALAVPADGTAIRFTCSVGLAELGNDTEGLDTLLRLADAALYRAKESGRDRVVAHGDDP